MTMLYACQKFQGEKNWLPKHQTCFSIYCVLLASLRDFGKAYRSPFPPVVSPPPRWLMTHLSPSLWRASVAGTDLLYSQKQKEGARRRRRRRSEGLAHPPQEALTMCWAHFPPGCTHQSPSSVSSFVSRVSSQAPQAGYVRAIDGEVSIAGVMHSKLFFWGLLTGQSPRGFTQVGSRGMANADGLFPCHCHTSTIAGVT